MDGVMPKPLHRIEPQLLAMPEFMGSAGEPSLGSASGWTSPGRPSATERGPSIPLMALMGMGAAGMMGMGGEAQGPAEPQMAIWKKPEREVDTYDADVMPDELKFGRAFAKAKGQGLPEFTWRGKRYNTKLKNATATLLNESGYS